MAKPIEIIIGSGGQYDPGEAATTFVIPILDGAEYFVSRGGYGQMPAASYQDYAGGGFTLLGGLQTSDGESWFVTITSAGSVDASGDDWTNGYNHTAVVTALKDRIGFRQPLGSDVPTLTSAATTSRSGRYFQDFHALVTVENIKATMPQVGATDANLITYLGEIRSAAIMRALNGVFSEPQIVDQPQPVFIRYGKNDQLENNTGLFVGYEIQVADAPDVAVQIDEVHLYFNAAVTLDLYLFKDGSTQPVWTEEVTTEADSVTEISLAGKVLNRGKYYFGYFQADLGSAKAYREQACEWNEASYYCAKPMQSAADGLTFDRENISYPVPAHGMNLVLSSFIDHTTQIRKKAAMLDELIGLTLAYQVLEGIVYAVRSNATERILKDQLAGVGIQLDLNGVAAISDSPQVQGLKQRIERETKRVRQSFYPKPKAVVIDVD